MEQKGSTNIQVAVRIRPLLPSEKEKKLQPQWETQNNIIYQIDDGGQKFGDPYSFDHIFNMDKTNNEIYEEIVKDFVDPVLNGLNSTIFAYGQTSSGKTFTMLGDKKNMGVMSLAIENIFTKIYNEKINDLLDPNNKDIKIREFTPAMIGLQNVKEELVSTKEQMYECLKIGNVNRHIGSTKANDRSSRSHTIFKIVIESTQINDFDANTGSVQLSSLNLVDLAGSERVAQTKATGVRLKEGGHINKSLSALGLVIKQLSDGQEFVNFRDSKLTRLLQDSLGGNSKTLIIATITLASIEDTGSTLAFAQRAKEVKNKPKVNEIISVSDMNKRHAALNSQLQKKLDEQLLINQTLKKTQEENSREVRRLQQQMKTLEEFQFIIRTPPRSHIPERRHTIGFSAHKKSLLPKNLLTDFDPNLFSNKESNSIILHENHQPSTPSVNEYSNFVNPLATILEEESSPIKDVGETPEVCLRMRLSSLEEEYNQLLTFTRHEDNIFNETSKKVAEELERQLTDARREILTLQNGSNEKELYARIQELEQQLRDKKTHVLELDGEVVEIMEQLISLQDILKNSSFSCESPKISENSVLQIIESFNGKVKTSKDIIEKEILKQMNNFEHVSQEPILLPNELSSFNDLLNELSLFESDVPAELISNMKKESIEDFQVLIKIYESFLRKNGLISRCFEKIKFLEEGKERNKSEDLSEEVDKLKGDVQMRDQNIEDLKMMIDHLNSTIAEKNKIIREFDNSFSLHEREKNDLRQIIESKTSEIELLSQKLEENTEEVKTVNLEVKTKIYEDLEKEHVVLRNELENLREEFSKISHENELLKHEKDSKSENRLSLEIREKDQIINETRNSNTNLRLELEILMDQLENLKVENEQLKRENEDFKNNNEIYGEKINSLQNEKNILISKIETKTTSLSELKKRCKVFIREIEQLKRDFSAGNEFLKREFQVLKTTMGKFKDIIHQLSSKILEKDEIISEIQKNNGNLKTELEHFSDKLKKIQSLEHDIGKITSEMESKDVLLSDLENKCSILDQEKENLNQEIVILSTKNQQLNCEIQNLMLEQQTKQSKQLENESLKREIKTLKATTGELEVKVDLQTTEISEKNKVISQIQKDNENLKIQLENLSEKCDKIETENGNLKMKAKTEGFYSEKVKSLETEIVKITSEMKSKDVLLSDLENKCSILDQEKENLNQEIVILSTKNQQLNCDIQNLMLEQQTKQSKQLENESLKREIETLKATTGELEVKVDLQTTEIFEKDKIVSQIQKDNENLKIQLENLSEKCDEIETENSNLKMKTKTEGFYSEKVKSLETEIVKISSEMKSKDVLLAEFEKQCTVLSQEKGALKQEIAVAAEHLQDEIQNFKSTLETNSKISAEKDKLINESLRHNRNLKIQLENLEEKFKTVTIENESLKKEVDSLQNKITCLNAQIGEKNKSLYNLENRCAVLNEDIKKIKQESASELNDLRNTIDKLSVQILEKEKIIKETQNNKDLTRQSKNGSPKESNQNELKAQRYRQLFDNARFEARQLQKDKEKLNSEMNRYKCELQLTNAKLEQQTNCNENLQKQLKEMQAKKEEMNGVNFVHCEEYEELRKIKENFSCVLCSVVEHCINEQKTVLALRHSQEERNRLKSCLRDFKSSNLVLKEQLQLLRNQEEADLNKINEILSVSRNAFKEYARLEKAIMQEQIEQLDSSNRAYLEEIMTLKNKLVSISTNCPNCDTLKAEISKLTSQIKQQQEELCSLTDKNKLLLKGKREKIQQIISLEKQLFEEQDRQAEIKYNDYLKFYRDNNKMQEQQIIVLQKKIEEYQHKATKNKKCISVQCDLMKTEVCQPRKLSTAGVQCNIIQETSTMQEKYNLMKNICMQRKEENAALRLENKRLKNMTKAVEKQMTPVEI